MADNHSHNTNPDSLTADVPVEIMDPPASDIPKTITRKKENQMADVDTITLSQEHADIRREGAEHTATLRYNIKEGTNEGVKETLKAGWASVDATKDARYGIDTRVLQTASDLSRQIDAIDDTLTAQIIGLARDGQDNRAQIAALGYQVRDGFFAAGKDAEINALKTQMEVAKQTTYLSDKIDGGNAETQRLINELKERDLSRMLIERNAALVEESHWGRHWRHHGDQNQYASQFAALQSQLQAFNSQLQETRQGMVNFGTMAGVGQTSTSNNVR